VSVKCNVITGATGLLGSHVAEALVARGERVRAVVRPSSDTAFLRSLGVELVEGDLDRPTSLPRAVEGADVVYHCAARVGDWGPWSVFQRAIIDATGGMLVACQLAGVGRFLHVSSINVYGRPKLREGETVSEEAPLGRDLWWWDYYCRAKIEAEALVAAYPGAWTVVRPSWIYGSRDRNTIPRVVAALREGRARIVGDGSNRLNIVHAADVAEGAIRAASHPGAVGRAYNLSSEGAVSQRELIDATTDRLGLPRLTRTVRFRLAFTAAFFAELVGRLAGRRRPPTLTRYAVALIGRPTCYSIERARRELGWSPRVQPLEGIRSVLDWYLPLRGIENAELRIENDKQKAVG
jgi:nucleoside-diphosphate-sugar epimerase